MHTGKLLVPVVADTVLSTGFNKLVGDWVTAAVMTALRGGGGPPEVED